MRNFAAAAILVICGLCVGTAEAQDCQLKQYESLPLNVVNDHLLIPVKVGDVQKNFALELGNALNGMAETTVDELSLSKRSINSSINVVRGQVKITPDTRAAPARAHIPQGY